VTDPRLMPPIVAPNFVGDDYTLDLGDIGGAVDVNSAGAHTITVPADDDLPFPVGTVIEVNRMGRGAVTIVAADGVTIRSRDGLRSIADQGSSVWLRKRAADDWVLTGDLGP
jgi:hypothetical protein